MTPRERPRLNGAVAGRAYGETTYEVTADAIEAYARATNDLNPRYLAGRDAVASPVWPVVPAFQFFMAAVRDPDLGADLRRLLHLAEEHELLATARPGDVLRVAGAVEEVDADAGTFTVIVTERNDDGVEVARVRGTMLVRGAGRPPSLRGEEPPARVPYEHTAAVDPDQPRRYAEASGDHNPIHLDRDAARRSGLRGVIVHGMCTMAVATAAVVDGPADGDPARVEHVQAWFARPVTPGTLLRTCCWPLAGEPGSFAFGTWTEEGARVLAARARVQA